MAAKKEQATELEWLKYFYQEADFGPAHEDVVSLIEDYFKQDTGKDLPEGYGINCDEDED